MEKDPVSGSYIESEKIISKYQGQKYYFSNLGNKALFESDPERYIYKK